MRRIANFIMIIIFAIFIAGSYGIVHDQITYSISNEYYTLFKFDQFGINEWGISNERTKVAVIGFLATWWVGLFLGIVYALLSIFLSKLNLKVYFKSIVLNVFISALFGILGYLFGILFLRIEDVSWYIPEQTINIQSFINVGSIHNFGYIGGIIGLLFGVYYVIKKQKIK